MIIDRKRENVLSITATRQEIAALVAGARMARDAMRAAPGAPPEALAALDRVLGDFDRQAARLADAPPRGGG